MALNTEIKSYVGFSAATVALVTVVSAAVIRGLGVQLSTVIWMSALMSLFGLVVWVGGRLQTKVRRDPGSADDVAGEGCQYAGPLGFLKRRAYWGAVLCLSALLLGAYSAVQLAGEHPARLRSQQNVVVRAIESSTPVAEPAMVEQPVGPPPALVLQGIVLDGSNSSAVINKRVIRLGEWVDGVQLIEVNAESVRVKWYTQTNRLELAR